MPVFFSPAKRLGLLAIACALNVIILSGCATAPSKRPVLHRVGSPVAAISVPARLEPVVRYGRYTLVELSPLSGQQDLMQQIVDITMPQAFTTSVGDALRYVLLRSGFSLCDRSEIRILNTLPLPAADFHLGPLTLESALRLLAGPGWRIEIDELTRRVCFAPEIPASPSGKAAHTSPIDDGKGVDTLKPMAVPRKGRS